MRLNLRNFLIERGISNEQLVELILEQLSSYSFDDILDLLSNTLELTDEEVLRSIVDEYEIEDCIFDSDGRLFVVEDRSDENYYNDNF